VGGVQNLDRNSPLGDASAATWVDKVTGFGLTASSIGKTKKKAEAEATGVLLGKFCGCWFIDLILLEIQVFTFQKMKQLELNWAIEKTMNGRASLHPHRNLIFFSYCEGQQTNSNSASLTVTYRSAPKGRNHVNYRKHDSSVAKRGISSR
jgi:hypothetical protein